MTQECLGCGADTSTTIELAFTDGVSRRVPCCDSCGCGGLITLAVVLAANPTR